MIAWAFVTLVFLADGEVRELRSQAFATWQACENARIDEIRVPMPAGIQARILRACRSETKS